MSFASKKPTEGTTSQTDFKMTFSKSNNKTTTNNNGSGLFMNVGSIKSNNKTSNNGFMNVKLQEKKEKIRDPKIIRFDSDNNIPDDNSNPNILKIVR